MTEPRREVRATQAFFEQLDEQLGDERGSKREPSSYDFQSHDLFAIVERFATEWDRLPVLIDGRTDYRVLVGRYSNSTCIDRLTLSTVERVCITD